MNKIINYQGQSQGHSHRLDAAGIALRSGVATLALLAHGHVFAATAAGEAGVAEAGAEYAEAAIVVTARHREEASQDVPVALSVVSTETLEKSGSYTLGQVQQLVPSLQVFSFNPRNTNINIRGLGSNVALTNDGLENGVGFYVDGVYYGRPGQSQFDLVDLQQIEVLRGPQGTLFGKNTTAGAINITTRLPSFDPELTAEVTGGNYHYHQVRASGSLPIVADKVALRLSVADTHRSGFLTNLHTGGKAQDYDNFSARAQLLVKPSADVSIRLIGDYSHQKQNFVLTIPVGYFSTYTDGTTIANNFLQRAARGGYTLWANTATAYDGLPEQLKGLVDGLWAIHSNDYDYAETFGRNTVQGKEYRAVFTSTVYETEHPVVHVHPETGERHLLLGHFFKRFVDFNDADSQRLYSILQDHITRPENTVRWRWQAGDVAVWDNRATQHRAIADFGLQRRSLRRATIAGETPVSINGRHSQTISQQPKAATVPA